MGFYALDKGQRDILVKTIHGELSIGIEGGDMNRLSVYFSDDDTYIRKTAYLCIGRIYAACPNQRATIIGILENLLDNSEEKIRQTIINAAGEIGKSDFEIVRHFFDTGLFDRHNIVRNAVIGSMKKMGEKNPAPVLAWSRGYLHHADKEIRREVCHGIELRGRTHPEDILPLLKELQHDTTKRVYSTLIHVLGQISYKKGCLEKVMSDIITWENKQLVTDAIEEIIDVHHRYRDFSYYTQDEARSYIDSIDR